MRSLIHLCERHHLYLFMNDFTFDDISTLINALRSDIVQEEAHLATLNAGDREWGALYEKEGTLIKLQYLQAQLSNRL